MAPCSQIPDPAQDGIVVDDLLPVLGVIEKTDEIPFVPDGIDLLNQHGHFEAEPPGTEYGDIFFCHSCRQNLVKR
jgi:hypothetical protein